ncbi:uncharacterized protein I303_103013 [Kwoniella dejecticola CBS 10117]|uniref:Minor histocompatibility antigen H13 n=1 Tax=Kwoniella dejecticola CBS 10117 TaxID=1296121 RepID=A0A1A6AAC9_9TREE|nr:minor histocompatibility antigen H13 [Kwoniella dejecticola CBS 10117]OBR87010.1 minor histocompatibility antigen H13 [Kwoniella dejecticola CBS 10117]
MPQDAELIGSYISLGVQALIPIILGSFKSLKTPDSTIRKRKLSRKAHLLDEEDDEEEEEAIEETLTWADSLLFPVFGSIALLGLFFLIKYVGKEWINTVLGVYFTGAGMFAIHSTFSSILNWLLRAAGRKPTTYHIRISAGIRQVFHLPTTLSSLILIPISVALPLLYIPLGRPYILSNVLALSLCTATLALLKLDSFLTAFLLLGVLLVYDIFWVFATPVMVTVAKSIDAPIKILSPKTSILTGTPKDFTMLGLGDIVIPGLVVALCLRYDLARYAKNHPEQEVTARSRFSKPYFITAVISYIIGLTTTVVVMHTFRAAQPALLYLSPACTLGPIILASVRGELRELWGWSDAPTEEDEKKTKIDETIEAPSEAAIKARAAAKAAKEDLIETEKPEEPQADGTTLIDEDDSWMTGGVVTPDEGKARKRKGGKKK